MKKLLVLIIVAWLSPVSAQVANSWIKSTSGNWEDQTGWSLGVLPGNSQSVMLTNQGWKAVAIGASTAQNFPGSMTVNNLTIRGASDTENVLLLNYAGTDVPLTVLNGLTLQDDGRILNFNSGLVVQGTTFLITNSTMIQDGGFVSTTNVQMNLDNAEYDLTNGIFEAREVWLGFAVAARFNQYGGAATISNLGFGHGHTGTGAAYALYGGYLSLPNGLRVTADGNGNSSYLQEGGSNQTTQVYLESGFEGGLVSFNLNGGLLADADVDVFGDDFGRATLVQNGGRHVITNTLNLAGGSPNGFSVNPGAYNLNGGTLSAGTIGLSASQGDAVFVQSNGTTLVGTFQAYSTGYYSDHNTHVTLAGGLMNCSNFTTVDGGARFNQTGGALVVSNLLDFGGARYLGGPDGIIYGRYTFTGGTVTASNINLTGDWIIGDGIANRISNPGFFSLSHTLTISNAVEQLGGFILASNATIDLAGSSSRLSFANTSGQTWAGGVTLVISDWNGSLVGGGGEQLKFGTSASALTPGQVAQIYFLNPAGFPSGTYPARILSTGEIVPVQGPTLLSSRSGSALVLTWFGNYQLLSATNVSGPYVPVSGASSPWTNSFAKPQEFFILEGM